MKPSFLEQLDLTDDGNLSKLLSNVVSIKAESRVLQQFLADNHEVNALFLELSGIINELFRLVKECRVYNDSKKAFPKDLIGDIDKKYHELLSIRYKLEFKILSEKGDQSVNDIIDAVFAEHLSKLRLNFKNKINLQGGDYFNDNSKTNQFYKEIKNKIDLVTETVCYFKDLNRENHTSSPIVKMVLGELSVSMARAKKIHEDLSSAKHNKKLNKFDFYKYDNILDEILANVQSMALFLYNELDLDSQQLDNDFSDNILLGERVSKSMDIVSDSGQIKTVSIVNKNTIVDNSSISNHKAKTDGTDINNKKIFNSTNFKDDVFKKISDKKIKIKSSFLNKNEPESLSKELIGELENDDVLNEVFGFNDKGKKLDWKDVGGGFYYKDPYLSFIEMNYLSIEEFEKDLEKFIYDFEYNSLSGIERVLRESYQSPFPYIQAKTFSQMTEMTKHKGFKSYLKHLNIKYEIFLAWKDLIEDLIKDDEELRTKTIGEIFVRLIIARKAETVG